MSRTSHRTALMAAFGCLLGLLGCSVQSDSNRPTSPDAAVDEPPKRAHDPLMARTPSASESLTMAASWSPPRPMRSKPARMRARVEPPRTFGVPTKALSAVPSDAELAAVPFLPQPLRPVPGTSSKVETEALAAALNEPPDADRGIEGIRRFVEANPTSRWAPSLHLNLGAISYGTGYFQDALAHWKAAWELAKAGEDPVSQQTANQAIAEYAKMNARLGRMADIEAIVEVSKDRHFMGDARVKMEAALEGLGTMRTRPGVAFKCGPFALANVATLLAPGSEKKSGAFLESVQSPTKGFSVSEVHAMAPRLGLNLQMAKREPGASVIVPAVVHWKVGHFAAVMREVGGRLLVKDPTFGNETWMTREALDNEASGYFLVATGALPQGWSKANAAEAAKLYGKGYTGIIEPDDTSDDDDEDGGDPDPNCSGGGGGGGPMAMATYRFHLLAASLHIEDTPVGHSAAVGPDVRVRVAYNQRESGQPTSIDFTSFGPQFVSNWVSYLVDNTTNAAANVTLRKRGGGGETHTGYSSGTQSWTRDVKTGAVLYRLTANTYKKVYPDGREEFYEQYIGTTGTQRRVFLTKVIDPQGNAITISYDTTYPTRISQIVDATGLTTVFHYAVSGQPYLVSSIEDPYGREATFTYATAASALRLQSIEDTIGIVSTFGYDSNGEITSMTTPYGTTTFGLSPLWYDTGHNLIRYLEATDPLGQKERLEYTLSAYITRVMPTLEQPRPSSSIVNYTTNADENANRNTFYWDKLAMKLAPGDYLKAHIYHWVRPSTTDVATSILETEVRPLEGRIFYNYPGQSQPNIKGTLKSPSVVARVVKDAAGTTYTQATKYEYNTIGNVTKIIDPVGRERLIEYASNGIDVTAIKQRTGTSGGSPVWTTMSTYTYGGGAPAHRPATMTDGAGKTTSYTYASNGQVLTTTNAKSEVTTFTYETNTSSPAYRRLLTLTGDVPGGNQTFTYDTTGRLATVTNSEGYTLAYDYDALDRIRTITYPDSSVEQREYEDHSLVASKDREGRWTRHMYNPLRERVVTQDPALRTTQTQWCRCGQLRRFVDGNGNITEWQRDVASRVTKKIQANGSFETYGYDFSGRRVTEVDAMSRTTSYEYTLDDRISKKDFSDTATPDVTYAYDTYFPRQTSRVDGAGTTTFAYHPYGTSTNGAGQVSLINGPLTDDTQKHTYDELGRLKKLEIVDDATQTTASYSEEYTFDARGRATTVANNLGSTTYAFVGQSNRPSTVSFPNGMQTLYDYFGATSDHLLKQIKNMSAGPTPTVISQFDYTYAPDRAIATWTQDQGSGAKTWTFGYDGARQLTSATLRNSSNAVLEDLMYGYDKAGNRIQAGNGTTAPKNYDVNNLNQLLTERDHGKTTFAGTVDEPSKVTVNGATAKVLSTDGGAPYKFEAVVNLDAGSNTVVVEAKDGQNNVATKTYSVTTTGNAKTFEYDANGNLRYEKQPNGTVIKEYRWDQQNRLVRFLQGTHESVYEYDGESKRVRIRELTSSVETKNETFVWCGSRICQKRSGTSVVRSYFVHGFEEGTNDYTYTRDHLGSIREVVGSDGTTITSRNSYGPSGTSVETGFGALSDVGFTGHHFDRSTGLALAWFRTYDPSLGRWLTQDPIGLKGGPNLYGYVNGDPINWADPLGLQIHPYRDQPPLPPGVIFCGQLTTPGTVARRTCCALSCAAHATYRIPQDKFTRFDGHAYASCMEACDPDPPGKPWGGGMCR